MVELFRGTRLVALGSVSDGETMSRILEGMYSFEEHEVENALEHFRGSDFEGAPQEGDRFFRFTTPGNSRSFPDRPFERFSD